MPMKAISRKVVETLEPVMETYKPPGVTQIYFQKFTLGENPFQFTNLRMVKECVGSEVKGSLEFLMDIR